MKTREDHVWESLLLQSAPAFTGETVPPFGFSTRMLAGLRDQQRQEASWERTGLRAIFASLVAVAGLALVTIVMADYQSNKIDPGVQSLALVEHLQVS